MQNVGALQVPGPPMTALRRSLDNPWLAGTVSFLPIVAVLLVLPNPMPSAGVRREPEV